LCRGVAAACLASDGQDRDVIVDVAVADQGRHERRAGGLRQSVWAICGDGVSEDRAHSREARVDVAVVVVDKAIGEQAEKAARLKGERACRAGSSDPKEVTQKPLDRERVIDAQPVTTDTSKA